MTPDQLLQCVDETSLINKQQRLTAKTYIDNYGRKIKGKKTVDDEEKYDYTIQTNKILSVVTVSTAAVEEQMLNDEHDHYIMFQYTPVNTRKERLDRYTTNTPLPLSNKRKMMMVIRASNQLPLREAQRGSYDCERF